MYKIYHVNLKTIFMKRILICFLLNGGVFSLWAQNTDSTKTNMNRDNNMPGVVDSSSTMKNDSNMNNNNSNMNNNNSNMNNMRQDSASNNMSNSNLNNARTDSSDNRNNSNVNMDNNMKMDSATNMNRSSTSNMNNSQNNGNNVSNSNMNNSSNPGMNNNGSGMINNGLNGQTGYAALPVLENSVPEAVVAKVKEKYGNTVYDITSVKRSADQSVYVIRTQENGTFKAIVVKDDGSPVQ